MDAALIPNATCVQVLEDAAAVAEAVAQRFVDLAREAIAARGVFHVALAGGETPRRCYRLLADAAVDWARVQVYFGDERCLSAGDPGRNDSMAAEALLSRVPVARVHTIAAELGPEAAAARYAALFDQGLQLDLVLLGMGEDGHTASLFPGNPACASVDAAVAVFGAPKPPPERVSLGFPVLTAARQRILMVAGGGKQPVLRAIARGEDFPVLRAGAAEWVLDKAAWPQQI